MAKANLDRSNQTRETNPEPDPISIAERVALKFEKVTPSTLGKPVIVDRGVVLAYENDLPHVKVYAWSLVHLHTGRSLPIDTAKVAKDCKLSLSEARGAIDRLVREGDLVRTRERGRELYRLVINYGWDKS